MKKLLILFFSFIFLVACSTTYKLSYDTAQYINKNAKYKIKEVKVDITENEKFYDYPDSNELTEFLREKFKEKLIKKNLYLESDEALDLVLHVTYRRIKHMFIPLRFHSVKPMHFDYELNVEKDGKQLYCFGEEGVIMWRKGGELNIIYGLNIYLKMVFSLFHKKDEERDFIAFAGHCVDEIYKLSMKSKTIKSK